MNSALLLFEYSIVAGQVLPGLIRFKRAAELVYDELKFLVDSVSRIKYM